MTRRRLSDSAAALLCALIVFALFFRVWWEAGA